MSAGLSFFNGLGNPPVYATEIVCAGLPESIAAQELRSAAKTDVLGIAVTTGRNGHAPGGIWLHFAIGGGLSYTGDIRRKSKLYAYDPPSMTAASALMMLLRRYRTPLTQCWTSSPRSSNVGRSASGAAQRTRPGDRARIHAPWRQRDIRRRRDAEGRCGGSATSTTSRCRRRRHRNRSLAQTVKPIDGARGVMIAGSADGASGAAKNCSPHGSIIPSRRSCSPVT